MPTAQGTFHQTATPVRMGLVVRLEKLNEIFADVGSRAERLRSLSEQLVVGRKAIVH